MSSTLEALPDGGRAVVIGGGPGGTACALTLQRMAAQMGRRVQITIVEGKQFTGERQYNQCAGVLAPPLPALLEERLDIPFPHHLSRGEIQGYVLHTAKEQIRLVDHGQPSVALRRVQFDAYMLDYAQQRGITVLPARVTDLEFHADHVVVYTENASFAADVVVGAFGLDEGSAALFSRQTAYRPPQALCSIVTKYHPGAEGMETFGKFIHAYLPSHPRVEFGALTPKGNHITINIAGRSIDATLMEMFLSQPIVHRALPNLAQARQRDPNDMRFFKGRFPCSLAQRYYGDRYVMIGDAAGLVRAFKGKGVTSAVLTGIHAAETILQAGVSAQAFHDHYRPANQDIIQDLPYGRGMRQLTILLSRFDFFTPVVRAARQNPALQSALFEAISAHAPYKKIVGRALRPGIVLAILRAMFARNGETPTAS